jgi:hypothetical protein
MMPNSSQKEVPTPVGVEEELPTLSDFTFLAPTEGETLYKNNTYEVRWNPLRLKEGQVARLWLMLSNGNGYGIAEGYELDLTSGTYTIPSYPNWWLTISPDDFATIVLEIGRNEQQGPGVIGFVTEAKYMSPTFKLKAATSSGTQ